MRYGVLCHKTAGVLRRIPVLTAATATTTRADENQKGRLVVWLNNGEKVFFQLEENPTTTFNGDIVAIATSDVYVSYTLDQLNKYTYETVADGIFALKDNEMRVKQTGALIVFENVKLRSTVQLFSANGVTLGSLKGGSNNTVTVSLENYPRGAYLINVNNTTYKVFKR